MKYACYREDAGVRRILSVHGRKELADRRMWNLWRTVAGTPFQVACCPDHKRKGDTLTMQEIFDSAEAEEGKP